MDYRALESSELEEGLIKKLITSLKCTACGKYYEASDVDVLGHEEDLWFLKTSCLACHAQFLVAAVLQESFDPELVSATGAESSRFGNTGKLTINDVLDMHNFLKNFDGDFSRIFNQNVS